MAKKKKSGTNKHLYFVTLLRSTMHVPEKRVIPATGAVDNDAENEAASQLQKELEAKFDALFGPLD